VGHWSLKHWARQVSNLVHRLCQWWWLEFLDLLPERVEEWLVGRGRALLAVAPTQDEINFELMTSRRQRVGLASAGKAEYGLDSIDRFLRSHGYDREDVDIGVRLPAERFFTRKLVLPAEVGGAIGDVVARDLARKTPFQLQDVFHGYVVMRATDADKISVRQWVIRSDLVTQAAATIGLNGANVAFAEADAGPDADQPVPFIWLRPNARADRSLTGRFALALGCAALLLVLGIGGHRYWRQQIALDALDSLIATTRAKAQQVRMVMDDLEKRRSELVHLRRRKSDIPGLVDIWEETTRVLPSHSWLTELRLSEVAGKHEYQITLVGFSAAATNLVGILDRSLFFTNATLTAPVAVDPVEGRERFALRANVRSGVLNRTVK